MKEVAEAFKKAGSHTGPAPDHKMHAVFPFGRNLLKPGAHPANDPKNKKDDAKKDVKKDEKKDAKKDEAKHDDAKKDDKKGEEPKIKAPVKINWVLNNLRNQFDYNVLNNENTNELS